MRIYYARIGSIDQTAVYNKALPRTQESSAVFCGRLSRGAAEAVVGQGESGVSFVVRRKQHVLIYDNYRPIILPIFSGCDREDVFISVSQTNLFPLAIMKTACDFMG